MIYVKKLRKGRRLLKKKAKKLIFKSAEIKLYFLGLVKKTKKKKKKLRKKLSMRIRSGKTFRSLLFSIFFVAFSESQKKCNKNQTILNFYS